MPSKTPGLLAALALIASPVLAAESGSVALGLKDHRFTPAQLTVPAGRLLEIRLTNGDAALEEFDSTELKVEQVVTPGGTVKFAVGPLKPGTYHFMGEFHARTAQGTIIATP